MNKDEVVKSGRKRSGGIDNYYTKEYIADFLSSIMLEQFPDTVYQYIEPTAGDGKFMKKIRNIKGYDLYPKADNIEKKDVFDLSFSKDNVVIGNPPFGVNSTLAIKIFNHIASFEVKAIGFILPKTFKKQSVINKLDRHYHLTFELDLPKNSFIVDGKDKHVNTVFQIWQYKRQKRPIIKDVKCDKYIKFVKKTDTYDLIIRRAGSKAGEIVNPKNPNVDGLFYIKLQGDTIEENKKIELGLRLMRFGHDNTVHQKSLTTSEICEELNSIMEVINEFY
jgi:hypothetical protein